MVFVCQLCNHYASFSYDCVFRHIGAVHSHENGFSLRCGFDSCPKVLKNYHAFRRHLRKKHGFCLKTYNPTMDEEQLRERNATLNPGAESEPENTLYVDHDSVIQGYQHKPISDKRSNAMYVLKLKQKYKLAQTTIDGILGDTEDMTERVVSRLQQRLSTTLSKAGVNDTEIPGYLEAFEDPDIVRPFNGLNTEYLQEKYFRDYMKLVVSVLIGTMLGYNEIVVGALIR